MLDQQYRPTRQRDDPSQSGSGVANPCCVAHAATWARDLKLSFRRMWPTWESAVISLIGAVSGAILGTGIGVALSQVLKDEGIKSVSVPVGQIAVYLAVAAVAGVLAGVGPARSAAKVDVLKAVVTD